MPDNTVMDKMIENPYLPYLMTVESVREEAPGVRTLRLKFKDEAEAAAFRFRTGQFGEYSVFGEGECTFCIASPSSRQGYIECTFRCVGRVTSGLARLEEGETMGFRGPFGNSFPIEAWKGKNIVFIAGGIALPPMRSVIWTVLDNRADYGDITIIYGAKSVPDLVYKQELEEWAQRADIRLITTVDPGGETPEWKGQIGFVPTIVEQAGLSASAESGIAEKSIAEKSIAEKTIAENSVAVVCGPPIMIKFTFPVLEKLGFKDENIFTTLENRMKCGIGKCGRCNVGKLYVCKDGPVFTKAQLNALPPEY